MKEELWKLLLEVSIPDEATHRNDVGFMNVLTWATSVDNAKNKIYSYFCRFDWRIIECSQATIVDPEFVANDDDFQALLKRARTNPQAIIFGTFHTYKLS